MKKIIVTITLLASLLTTQGKIEQECRIKGLYGTLPKEIGKTINEIKQQNPVISPPAYQPIRELGNRRIYSRLLFIGDSGTGKTITAEKLAEQAGAQYLTKTATSLVSSYMNGGAEEINKLKQEALDLYNQEHKHVVIIINEVDAIIRNATTQTNSATYRSYHNASQELWNMLSDFEDDPRITIIMTTNTLKDADQQVLSRLRGRQIKFELPGINQRTEFIEGTIKENGIDFFELFAKTCATSPVFHMCNKTEKPNEAYNFTEKKGWYKNNNSPYNAEYQDDMAAIWMLSNLENYETFFGKGLKKDNSEQEKKIKILQAKGYSESSLSQESNFPLAFQHIRERLLQQLSQQLGNNKNIVDEDTIKQLVNYSPLKERASGTRLQ